MSKVSRGPRFNIVIKEGDECGSQPYSVQFLDGEVSICFVLESGKVDLDFINKVFKVEVKPSKQTFTQRLWRLIQSVRYYR